MRKGFRALACALGMGLIAGCGGGGGGGGGGGFLPLATSSGTTTPTSPVAAAAPAAAATPTTPETPALPTTPTTPSTPVTGPAAVEGRVTAQGVPVANAAVRAGTQTTTTDAQGHYRLEFDAAVTTVTVVVTSAGRLTMAKQAGLAPGKSTTQDIQLQAADVQRTFYAADGVIAIVNGAVIDIPKDAIQDAAGAAYNGPVQLVASYRNPTTADGVDAFPQPYEGEAGTTRFNLQTVGVIEATLATPAGQPLQLRAPATLVYPGVSTVDHGAATIPLWYYDEARALWVMEGDAARQSDGSYKGTVSHFTVWNLDVRWGDGFTGVTLNFCVNFQSGAASRHGIFIYLEGPGFSLSRFPAPLASGNHQFLNIPADTPATLRFVDQGNGTTQVQAIAATAPGHTVELSACTSLVGTDDAVPPPPPVALVPVPADTPVNALTGSLISSWTEWGSTATAGAENGWIDTLTADASGAITGTGGFNASEEMMDSLSGQMAVGGYFSLTATRRAGGTAPPNGPILFTGRVAIDPFTFERMVEGVWSYVSPPAGVETPAGAYFRSNAS